MKSLLNSLAHDSSLRLLSYEEITKLRETFIEVFQDLS